MAQSIREVMTSDPRTVTTDATVVEAARAMREDDIGDVIVTNGGGIRGIVTDRDIAIRAVAEGRDPNATRVGEIASETVHTLTPDQTVEDAIRLMREKAVRRVPVVQDGRPVGVVAIGDLAVERDDRSALAEISAADPNE